MTDALLRSDLREVKLVTLGDSGLCSLRIAIHDTPFSNLFDQRADESFEDFLTRAFGSARQQAMEHRYKTTNQVAA